MTARAELFASMIVSPGMCWGDEQVTTPILQEAPMRMPVPVLLQFPISIGAAEPFHQYRHASARHMRVWVATMLDGKHPADEQAAYVVVSDLAVAQLGRSLHGIEGELLTSALRDVWTVLEAARMRTPGRMFR